MAPYFPVMRGPNGVKEETAAPMEFFAIIGRNFVAFLGSIGSVARFAGMALYHAATPPFFLRHIGQQMLQIGYFSLPVVGLTALFTGGALAQQIYIGSLRFNAESAVASVVVIAIVRELGPVLGGLMVAGRVSSAMAAEIGTMRVTEQIDALVTLSTDPIKYLIVPRLIAAVLTLPFLVLIANTIGVYGAAMAASRSSSRPCQRRVKSLAMARPR